MPATSRRAARVAALLFVLPYLLIGAAWIGTNPIDGAPDEQHHFVKALGIAKLDIGEEYTGPPSSDSLVSVRNASISRVVNIPSELDPQGYRCFAGDPQQTADCQPTTPPAAGGEVAISTPMGAYPPFLYLPAGLAAQAAGTPVAAFMAARTVLLLLAGVLLYVGARHLVRWLGRGSLLGAYVGLTPVAVFSMASVTTSGLEIASAFAVAAFAVVAIRKPGTMALPGTQVMIAAVGATLALSRQLGAVTLVVLLLVVLLRVGWRPVWALVRERRPVFLLSLLVLLLSGVTVALWELGFDHPSNTGPVFSFGALQTFDFRLLNAVRYGVGVFGWLDAPMPMIAMALWICAVVAVCGAGLLLADRADFWTILGMTVASVAISYAVYATVFYPIEAAIQGRQLIPMFLFIPMLAGVVVVERLTTLRLGGALTRAFVVTGVVVAALQVVGLWFNGRRYAVGTQGPVGFLDDALWAPAGGWVLWLSVGAAGALALLASIVNDRPRIRPELPVEVAERVER